MRVAQIRSMDVSNGEGIGVSCFSATCYLHCPNCYNSELWPEDAGRPFTQQDEDKIIELMKPNYIVRFSMLGGEPLLERNHEQLKHLFARIKSTYPNKKIWCWTGNMFENVKSKWSDVLAYVDVLCDGPYIHEQRNPKLKYVGSENQRVIDIEDTLENGCVCCHLDK